MNLKNLFGKLNLHAKRIGKPVNYTQLKQIDHHAEITLEEIKQKYATHVDTINAFNKAETENIVKKQNNLESEIKMTSENLMESLEKGKNVLMDILQRAHGTFVSILTDEQNKELEYYETKRKNTKNLRLQHEKVVSQEHKSYQKQLQEINKQYSTCQNEIENFNKSTINLFNEKINKILETQKKLQNLNIGIMAIKQKKLESKLTRNKKIIFSIIFSIIASVITVSGVISYMNWQDSYVKSDNIKSSFVIQNLRGDTIDTWVAWQITSDRVFQINLVNSPEVTSERFDIIQDTIKSQEILEIDDSLLHKGPKGQTSTYYVGWTMALQSIKTSTTYPIPTNIVFGSVDREIGDVVIILTNNVNADGYTAYTTAIADEVNHQLLKARITVYGVDRLSNEDLTTIVRHEIGHALGLAHSTAPEDLMHPIMGTDYPYISECDINAITALYDGSQRSQVICEK